MGIELNKTWSLPFRSSLVLVKYNTRQKVERVQERSTHSYGMLKM